MDEIARRALMKGAAIGALAFTVGGAEVMLTPRQARVQRVPFRTLTADQATTLEAMGEGLMPGGRQRDLAEQRADADYPSHGRHDHGQRRSRFGDQ